MSSIRPLILALTCTTLVPTLARAQAGILFGRAVESGESDFSGGYSVAGTFALRRTARLGVRFDLGYQTFTRSKVYSTPPCLPPSAGGPPCAYQSVGGHDITALSSTASVVLRETPGRNSFYWMAGVGVYAFTNTPSDGRYTRLGLNAGGGITFGNAVFEIRYHGLIDPRTTRAFIPITLGFRF